MLNDLIESTIFKYWYYNYEEKKVMHIMKTLF